MYFLYTGIVKLSELSSAEILFLILSNSNLIDRSQGRKISNKSYKSLAFCN